MAYSGRRGPNVSAYIANLNAIPTAEDLQSSNQESFIDDDLAMFTNTQFFDFDLGQEGDLQAGSFAADGQPAPDSFDGKGLEFTPGQSGFDARFALLLLSILSSSLLSPGLSLPSSRSRYRSAGLPAQPRCSSW
jgi:hypothetical protein